MRILLLAMMVATASTTAAVAGQLYGDWYLDVRQGYMEMSTNPSPGNSMTISCTSDGYDGTMHVQIGGQPVRGLVKFVVDGSVMDMMTWGDQGEINTDCRVCGQNFTSLWEMMRRGRTMAIIPENGPSLSLSLRGTSKAMPAEACYPKSYPF